MVSYTAHLVCGGHVSIRYKKERIEPKSEINGMGRDNQWQIFRYQSGAFLSTWQYVTYLCDTKQIGIIAYRYR